MARKGKKLGDWHSVPHGKVRRVKGKDPDAFRQLQLLSSQKNKKMFEIARSIVEADQAFDGRITAD